jgi:hypothetical protein
MRRLTGISQPFSPQTSLADLTHALCQIAKRVQPIGRVEVAKNAVLTAYLSTSWHF